MQNLFLKASQMNFGSGSYNSPAFESFARSLKAEINKICKQNGRTLIFNKGHFYCSGFISNKNGSHIYRSISDVRGRLKDQILIRTAKSTKDYSGGANNYTTYGDFADSVESLFNF